MAGYHKWQELLTLREHLGSPPVFGGSFLNSFLFSVLCCVVFMLFFGIVFNLCFVPYPWLSSVLSNVYLYVLNSHAVTVVKQVVLKMIPQKNVTKKITNYIWKYLIPIATCCILWFNLFSSVSKHVVYCDLKHFRQCQSTFYIVI
jgi:hypothetical protein